MTVFFKDYEIRNTSKEYVINHIKDKWRVQDYQIAFTNERFIILTNKLGEPFAEIATYQYQ